MTKVDADAAFLTEARSKDSEVVGGQYDTWAEKYSKDVFLWDYRVPGDTVTELQALHSDFSGIQLLDAGCGDGLMADFFRPLSMKKVVGIDLSDGMLEIAKSRKFYDELKQQDLSKSLDFETESFDVVACLGVTSYLDPKGTPVISEFVRLCKSGGHVIITVRSDLTDTEGWIERFNEVEADGKMKKLKESRGRPYLPKHPDLGSETYDMFVFQKS
eukprot:GFYU01016298.1.p1 GENE.GFYU01016298.1~~GFYU01016298.1.p1  ORF type:complete len:216 (-),score=52.48 GFYU01016298.1:35-682(-)